MELTTNELKLIKKLKDKKYRRLENLFLVEGKKLCEEVCKSKYEIKYTLASSEEYKNYPNFLQVEYGVLKAIATTETPQEVVCVCVIPKKQDGLPCGNSLILDGLQDPGNIGTLIRSAVAFDFTDIYFVNTVDIFSEKVIRGSMGAVFKINSHICDRDYIIDNKSVICDTLVGTDMFSNTFEELSLNNKVALIIGNEGNGVSKELLSVCDQKVTLEMANNVESLNASIAGSILMYQIFNRK